MTARLDCTPPRASLDPPNEALTDTHLWSLMAHFYENETQLGHSRMNNESDDADSLSKASPTEKHSNGGPRNVLSRAAAPRAPPKSLFEDFTDAVVTGPSHGNNSASGVSSRNATFSNDKVPSRKSLWQRRGSLTPVAVSVSVSGQPVGRTSRDVTISTTSSTSKRSSSRGRTRESPTKKTESRGTSNAPLFAENSPHAHLHSGNPVGQDHTFTTPAEPSAKTLTRRSSSRGRNRKSTPRKTESRGLTPKKTEINAPVSAGKSPAKPSTPKPLVSSTFPFPLTTRRGKSKGRVDHEKWGRDHDKWDRIDHFEQYNDKQQNGPKSIISQWARANVALATEDDLRGWKQDLDVVENPGSHLEMYKSMMYEKCDLSEKFIWEETGFWANSEHYKLKQAKGCTYVDTLV